jgi:hypothetical protein
MMILQHDATLSWFVDGPLATCRAKLWRARRSGHLTVSAGRVWVTRAGDLDDHVLEAGQELELCAHETVVVGPWRDGTLARLAWRSDQPRALGARAFAALAAAGRRWVACGVRAVGLLRATLAGR